MDSLDWEVATVLEYGETLCKDKSIFDKEKEVILTEMKSMGTALNSIGKNVEERKRRCVDELMKHFVKLPLVKPSHELIRFVFYETHFCNWHWDCIS